MEVARKTALTLEGKRKMGKNNMQTKHWMKQIKANVSGYHGAQPKTEGTFKIWQALCATLGHEDDK